MNKEILSKRKLSVVAIGGGGGTSQVLLASQPYFHKMYAVVSVTDTGSSTGIARELGNMPAPGDLRNNIGSLAKKPNSLLPKLLQHRFVSKKYPEFDGMAFGNLMIAALTNMTGSFEKAVKVVQYMVDCIAEIIPVSTQNTHLCANLENGDVIKTELAIKDNTISPIKNVFIEGAKVSSNPYAIKVIKNADLVIIGPGSFFTSIMATLAFPGIKEAIKETKGKVLYICNTTTLPNQTEHFNIYEHVKYISDFVGEGSIDYVFVNHSPDLDPEIINKHKEDGLEVLTLKEGEIEKINKLVRNIIIDDFAEVKKEKRELKNKLDTIRHDPDKLSRNIMEVMFVLKD